MLPKSLGAAKRSFHLGISQGSTQNVAEWFPEGFSAKPDSINSLMNMIYTRASHNSVTPFNLFCRSAMERWTIKGLRIGNNKEKSNRSVVIAAGMQTSEYSPIGVALYTAAVLSQNPIKGVEVTVFPVFKPKEFELQWHNEQIGRMEIPSHSDAIRLSLEEYEWIVEGPLRSYVMKRGTNFVDFVMNMNGAGSSVHLKHNSLSRPFRQAGLLLQSIPQPFAPNLAQEGERTLFEQLASPPTIVIELRDKNKLVDEDNIAGCAEELLTNIHSLIEETTNTRVL